MGRVDIPAPDVMPVDREAWRKQLHLSNFVNSYYQLRDVESLVPTGSILVIGLGQGLDTQVLRWRGYSVTTFDIDPLFGPDVVGSVTEMDAFRDAQFDVVIASHVLEHQAVPYLDKSLSEIARVGKHALIYLPVAGRHSQVRISPGFRGIDVSVILDLFNYFHKPDGVTALYCQGQHFWEVGMRGFRVRELREKLREKFSVVTEYRNRDWTPSYNFVLRSKRHS